MHLLTEYIWLDGNSPQQIRAKIKILDLKEEQIAKITADWEPGDFPVWSFDGSSTKQAEGNSSDCLLQPVKVIPHPFYSTGYAVLCEVMNVDGTPHETNTRAALREAAEFYEDEEALFGMEQEYTLCKHNETSIEVESLVDLATARPQGDYYCGVGSQNIFGRKIAEDHMNVGILCDLKICGINAEVMPGQWEYQIGPLSPLEMADQLWLSRWILYRIGEMHNVNISFDPKPVEGDWNGTGCHTNFSTASMRQEGGIEYILKGIEKLSQKHELHMKNYGIENEKRMTGMHETCKFDEFRFGNSDRGASIRIPPSTYKGGRGYFEDRRPAANIDPYIVCKLLLETVCGN